MPSIKPKVIQYIQREETGGIIVTGINVKAIDFDNNAQLDKYLEGIKEIITEEVSGIYIEGQEGLNGDILKYIEETINIKMFYGEDIKIKFLPIILKKTYRILKDNLEEKEILILDDNKERIKKTIKEISKYLGYISVIGLDRDQQDDLYDYILEETGISIFYPLNVDKIAGNYSIVVNFLDDVDYIFNKLRRNSLVFDFSNIEHESINNRPPYIQDFYFIFEGIEVEGRKIVNTKISSSLFEALSLGEYKGDILLYGDGKHYFLRNYIDNFVKIKGRF